MNILVLALILWLFEKPKIDSSAFFPEKSGLLWNKINLLNWKFDNCQEKP